MATLFGSFSQILTLAHLPFKGIIADTQLEVIEHGGILIENGQIMQVGKFEMLAQEAIQKNYAIEEQTQNLVLMPGLVDCHTHICYAGNRSVDYAMRVAGTPYLEIAKAGGGIKSTVRATRDATLEELTKLTLQRADRHLQEGITTCEVKSGYGLSVADELKILEAIRLANQQTQADLIATCLAAHICPPEFTDSKAYLEYILVNLLPEIKRRNLSNRIDIFVEDTAFSEENARYYLMEAKKIGFDTTIHADQFGTSGSRLAVELNALSADHLEHSGEAEIRLLADSATVAVVLPGASMGLGMQFAPARRLLDAGCCVAISTDWNPGSAPMGDLWMQAAVLGASEKLTLAETFAAITFRAAKALNLNDRGTLQVGKIADMIAFPCKDYREILYYQGKMRPIRTWKSGALVGTAYQQHSE
jgi:imidazolonepropionase